MDDAPRPAKPALAQHQLVTCTTCVHVGGHCDPGFRLMARLRQAVEALGTGADFEISGTVTLTACQRSCRLVWRATTEATWVFGDVSEASEIGDLVRGVGQVPEGQAVLISRLGPLQ